ncbi:MAG: dockerin type I repeat-containing protein [Planctomycetota bacterium]
MASKIRIVQLLATCGLATAAAGQPFEVSISGATLLETFLTSPASTNDFLDLDGDGVAGSVNADNEQLANNGTSLSAALASDYFIIQYTAVGSGNGIIDLDTRGFSRVDALGTLVDGDSNYLRGIDDVSDTTPDNPFGGAPGSANLVGDDAFVSSNVADGFMNRIAFISGGSGVGLANPNTPRAYPFRSDVAGSHSASTSTNDATHGVQIDLAPTDVPVSWFITQAGAPGLDAFPNTPGYGNNSIVSLNADGTVNGRTNALATLRNTNTNTASPDQNTIFSTSLTTSPVGALVNFGVGYDGLEMSNLRHGFATGRLKTGENLVFVTRDSGSGTRNAFANGICLDPSFCIGENIGPRTSSSVNDLIGPDYQPSNKGGSSRMDATVINTRLGVGFTGAERLFNRGYKTSNNGTAQLDMLAIRNDIFGTAAATFNRPFIDNILENDADTGYVVQAPSVIASIGDPRNETMPGGTPGNTNPPMDNPAAAAYLNNITAAVAAFAGDPGTPEDFFSPGEFLGFNFIPVDATDFVPGNGTCDPVAATTNATLQAFVRATNVLGNSVYASFDNNANGLVPARTAGVTYADGVANGSSYISESGSTVLYGSMLSDRNKIAGDFNADLLRDWNDVADVVLAWEERDGGASWTPAGGVAGPAGDFVLDIVGDFNGDGSFDLIDVRYFADGLSLDPSTGLLNRAEGFVRADNASASGNAFGTTLATGAAYTAGASAADIAGATGTTPGFHPIGADGVVDATDLDYIYAQFTDLSGGELDWTVTEQIVQPNRLGLVRDLSADVNGDLLINQDDICAALAFLGTSSGDVNLDGVVNAADESIASGNLGSAGGWADGDVNGDGTVTQADVNIITGAAPDPCSTAARDCCDQNGDGDCNPGDFNAWILNFNSGDLRADTNQNGVNDPGDFNAWILAFNSSQSGTPQPCQ